MLPSQTEPEDQILNLFLKTNSVWPPRIMKFLSLKSLFVPEVFKKNLCCFEGISFDSHLRWSSMCQELKFLLGAGY